MNEQSIERRKYVRLKALEQAVEMAKGDHAFTVGNVLDTAAKFEKFIDSGKTYE